MAECKLIPPNEDQNVYTRGDQIPQKCSDQTGSLHAAIILDPEQLLLTRFLPLRGLSSASGSHFFEPDPQAKYMGEIAQFLKNWFFDPRGLNFAAVTAKFSESLAFLTAVNSYYTIRVIGSVQYLQNRVFFLPFWRPHFEGVRFFLSL